MKNLVIFLFINALFFVSINVTEPPSSASLQDKRAYVLSLVNEERTSRNLSALYLDDSLNSASQNHSQWMASKRILSHTGQNQTTPSQRAGFSVSENVAYGSGLLQIHNSWMNSSGHRANILKSSSTRIGIGLAINGRTIFATQNFAGRDFVAFPLTDLELSTAKSQIYSHITSVSPHLTKNLSLENDLQEWIGLNQTDGQYPFSYLFSKGHCCSASVRIQIRNYSNDLENDLSGSSTFVQSTAYTKVGVGIEVSDSSAGQIKIWAAFFG